eukprot:Rmarinus@m.22026
MHAKLWVLLVVFCFSHILCWSTNSEVKTSECTDDELFSFVMSSIDVSLLVSGGCGSVSSDFDALAYENNCCDATHVILAHPCTKASNDFFSMDGGNYPPHMDFIYQLAIRCGVVVGVGYDKSDCGNGIVAENEGCDDGNNVSGDGCTSDCFIEEGYSCYASSESQSSICLRCTSNCQMLRRHVCSEPGAACGDCIDGYSENEEGECAAVKHVLYTVINQFN